MLIATVNTRHFLIPWRSYYYYLLLLEERTRRVGEGLAVRAPTDAVESIKTGGGPSWRAPQTATLF